MSENEENVKKAPRRRRRSAVAADAPAPVPASADLALDAPAAPIATQGAVEEAPAQALPAQSVLDLPADPPAETPEDSAPAAPALSGFVDRCDLNGVEGWAALPGSDRALEVEILADGEPVGCVLASVFRRDLQAAGVGEGNHGFQFPLPVQLLDGREHSISVRERETGIELQGSPLTFRSGAEEQQAPEATAAPAPLPTGTDTPPVEEFSVTGEVQESDQASSQAEEGGSGFIDHVQAGHISGWYFSGVQGHFQRLQVFVDDKFVTDVVADQYRADLEKAGLNNGVCSFVWQIPDSLHDGHDHVIQVRTPSGKDLNRSPVFIKGSAEAASTGAPGEVSAGPSNPDLGNLFVNRDFSGVEHRRREVQKGGVLAAEGWELFADSNDAGQVSFWHSIREVPGTEALISALRIKSKRPLSLLRLFGTLERPSCFFFAPFTLSFHASNQSATQSIAITVRIGTRTPEGRIDTLFRSRVLQGAGSAGTISLSVPADVINRMSRVEHLTPCVTLEFGGEVSVELSEFSFGIGASSLKLVPEITGQFEDPVIEAQAGGLTGFMEAGATEKKAPAAPHWRSWPAQQLTEIVIPVYDALEYVQQCVHSVLEYTDIPHLLTIVDDGSLPECGQWLDQFAAGKPWVKVLHNARNSGYTRAINRAIRESSGANILLLNSDTQVSPGWLSGILAVAESNPKVGLVGPLSNAASWQSVPAVKSASGWAINALPQGMSVADYAELVRSAGRGDSPEVPILNGFCLFIKRKVFDTIGLFDEEAFPMGFGEENDFCFRAADAGFTLRIATDTYVFHAKTKSFGSKRREDLIVRANQILHERYGKERFTALEGALSALPALEQIRQRLRSPAKGPGDFNG